MTEMQADRMIEVLESIENMTAFSTAMSIVWGISFAVIAFFIVREACK